MRIPFNSSAQLSTSPNILAPALADSIGLVNGVSTTPAQPNARKGTLARAATMMIPQKPLAPPPTALQSLKAILLASCLCNFFITREFPSECAVRVKCSPTMYTRFSMYSS